MKCQELGRKPFTLAINWYNGNREKPQYPETHVAFNHKNLKYFYIEKKGMKNIINILKYINFI